MYVSDSQAGKIENFGLINRLRLMAEWLKWANGSVGQVQNSNSGRAGAEPSLQITAN